jgi:colanic acid biosynthesis glycosyl transferase WcaI
MLEKLRRIVGKDRRTVLLPNWIHKSLQKEIEVQTVSLPPRREQTLFYSGNVGVKQGLPDFIKNFITAKAGWRLQINGGGVQMDALQRSIKGRNDIELGGVLSEPDYVHELLTAKACLVTQTSSVGANFLPSKLLPAMAAGTPVLAVCEKNSPLGREVIEGGIGEVVAPGNVSRLTAVLRQWAEDPSALVSLGTKARQWSARYERGTVLARYLDEIFRLTSRRALRTPPAAEPVRFSACL